jgi:hypothetical protein
MRVLARVQKMTEPVECCNITTIVQKEPDDILICCGSPEERCKGIVQKLAPDYRSSIVLLLRYSNHDSEKRERNIQEMKDRLKSVGVIHEIVIDEDKPIPILREIIQRIIKCTENSEAPKITIDISTMIKWHLLILLKGLDFAKKNGTTRILYTEPEDYITDLFQPLSFGIHSIFPIPTYSGNFDFSKNSLLVLVLGYEGDRALALYEEMDPTECLLLIAKPAYHREWEGRTEKMNKEIINTVGASKVRYVDSRNPIVVAAQLRELLSSSAYLQYNHIISPLGTKPQTVGLHLYLSTNPPNTTLVYGSPARHNELFYSKGIGRSWILPYF